MLKPPIICGFRRRGLWWFRVFGRGIHWKDTRVHSLMFSERVLGRGVVWRHRGQQCDCHAARAACGADDYRSWLRREHDSGEKGTAVFYGDGRNRDGVEVQTGMPGVQVMQTKKVTLPLLRKLLKRHGGTLKSGPHSGSKECLPGEVCVRELRSIALVNGEWLGDHPDGKESSPTDRACQVLNDANWSTDDVRTEECLPLALLSEKTAIADWYKGYAEGAVRVSAAMALRFAAAVASEEHKTKLNDAAQKCADEGTESAAWSAWSAAALSAAAESAAATAATAAATAATAKAAWSATRDAQLRVSVALLIASHKTLKPWLDPDVIAAVAEAEKLIPK